MATRRGNITKAPTAQENSKRVNVNLSKQDHYQFKMICDEQDRDLSDVIRAFIQNCVEEGKLNA